MEVGFQKSVVVLILVPSIDISCQSCVIAGINRDLFIQISTIFSCICLLHSPIFHKEMNYRLDYYEEKSFLHWDLYLEPSIPKKSAINVILAACSNLHLIICRSYPRFLSVLLLSLNFRMASLGWFCTFLFNSLTDNSASSSSVMNKSTPSDDCW
jgi:hypothetical protein